MLLPLVGHANPQLDYLENQLATTTRQLNQIQAQLANQNKTVSAAQTQAERATVAALRASRYPPLFWQWQSVQGHAPAPGLMGYMARQQAADVTRLSQAYGTLFKLYGQAQSQQAKLLGLRQTIAHTEGRANRRQRAQLAKAGIDASALAVQLAAQLGEVLPPAPPPPPEPVKAKPKTPPTEPLRSAAPLPDLVMEDAPTQTDKTPSAAAPTPRGRPISGPVLVGFKQGKGAEAEGVVLGGPAGTAVHSPLTAKVLFAGEFRQFGGLVILQGTDGHDEVLGGMDALNTRADKKVKTGQTLGQLGQRGRLYWEVRVKGTARNPLTLAR